MNVRLLLLPLLLTTLAGAFFLLHARAEKGSAPENPAPVSVNAEDAAAVQKIDKSEAEWKSQLTPEQFAVVRRKSTERAGSSPLLKEHGKGVFRCVACGLPLFASDSKFESGTGWPSFFKPFVAANVRTAKDKTFWTEREEVLCARCGAHLGHVFDDGPAPTGLRYCLNGVALKFEARP